MMNGVKSDFIEPAVIDRKPIITCAGELEVFSALEDSVIKGLPLDTCEWRRSLGRTNRDVHVSATFIPFSPKVLPKNNQWDLIRMPLFHVYWTECNDLDSYKVNIKEDIEEWLKELQAHDISDWLIIVIENYDGKRANKLLPRTTVLDKVRSDFGPKHGDRCISVINPGKPEARNADSWRGLISRIRQLLLISYSKALTKFEDHIRHEREKRNEAGWKFMDYLKLQEELAQVFEMLGLYDEALVQYDELDALFSQFVVNEPSGNVAPWLKDFKGPLQKWHGLKLGPSKLASDASLLELRAYLFAKQAHMLLLLEKVWEVASRCLPFLHNCIRELAILEITAPPGAITCWLFLACMEVLNACDKYNQAEQIEAYSTNTSGLWAYGSQKLLSLGQLCGLMPDVTPQSDQLHTVVYLSAGMGDNPGKPDKPSPTDKLKQALCSQTVFSKTYLELAELAMGTYKHIGRLRNARLIGKEVAAFYMLQGELQKSAAFLGDALRTFEQDKWKELAAQTRIELAECHKKSNEIRKYVRSCAAICAATEIDELIRWGYFDEMRRSLKALNRTLLVPFKDIISINYVRVLVDNHVMQDAELAVEISLDSNFPREILCDKLMLSIETEVLTNQDKGRRLSNLLTSKDLQPVDASLQKLRIQRHLSYQQDKQLSSSSVVCRSVPIRRADSNATPIYHSEFNDYLHLENVKLGPGTNIFKLRKKMGVAGKFYLGQIAVHVHLMELISVSLQSNLVVEVKRMEPTIRIDVEEGPLLSGIEQGMKLSVTNGSYKLEKDVSIKLTSSMGLLIKYKEDVPFCNSLQIPLDHCDPFSSSCVPIKVLAESPSKEHQIVVNSPWSTKPLIVPLNFTAPLLTTWRLYTAQHRKFIQIVLTNQCSKTLKILDSNLSFNENIIVKSFNKNSSQEIVNGLKISFAYELLLNGQSFNTLKGLFSLKYNREGDVRNFTYNFELSDYQTLFFVDAHIEPTKGSEFCRVGTLCHLHLNVSSQSLDACSSLMYEVLPEQSVWAVCGRTAGVLSFEMSDDTQNVVLDVMPLSSGFLPLPLVRLSKYIPADFAVDNSCKSEQHPRLTPFISGQVYNASKGHQVYVISSGQDA